jgi:predicted cupin superfamily sugar epimerase
VTGTGWQDGLSARPDVLAGDAPQGIVPAGWWQAARPLSGWVLVGCTVSPGFQVDGFELAPGGFDIPRT